MPELNIVEKVIALEAVDLLRNLKPDQLARIASIAKEETHPPGAVILDAKRTPDSLYVILDGTVDITTEEGVSTRAVRTMFWALGRCSIQSRSASLRALRTTANCCASRVTISTSCSRIIWRLPRRSSP
jgi:CRP-like cAMP-binding protein